MGKAWTPHDIDILGLLLPEKVYHKGQFLYCDGDEFKGLYVVIAGSLKGYCLTADGDEQVCGFYLPGEWIALDGLPYGPYCSYMQALDTCCVRRLSPSMLAECLSIPQGRTHFFSLMSEVIRKNKVRHYQLGQLCAQTRLAFFILELASRIHLQGASVREFRLPMTRGDIASYLGLTPETVSRVIVNLEYLGVLRLRDRYITLLQPERLGLSGRCRK
ncbi:helix-turn-helix domain-containing protein (plasmid) [Serratia nevei]|uniref:helix-turn-helix domain-containing protein n=1 Tax=Serratia nevei TaxID=2703794 RepID=UPI003F6D24B9